jgi:hypothetical protein
MIVYKGKNLITSSTKVHYISQQVKYILSPSYTKKRPVWELLTRKGRRRTEEEADEIDAALDHMCKITPQKKYIHSVLTCSTKCTRYHQKTNAAAASSTGWKVAGSIPDGVIDICYWRNPSGSTVVLGSTQPLTEMRVISWRVQAACAWGWQPYYLHVSIF